MQLEDQTFLTVMDKLMDNRRPRQESPIVAKLKKTTEYRRQCGDSSNYVYVCGLNADDNIALADLELILKEFE